MRVALPLFLTPAGATTIGGLRVLLDQRGWPRSAIPEGPEEADGGRRALHVPFEYEETLRVPRSKAAAEWIQVAMARLDLQRTGANDLNGAARYGANPPDLHVGERTVEVSQFTTAERRNALSLLSTVRRAILSSERDRFAHLRGRLVMMGFADPRGLPPRGADTEAQAELLRQLERLDAGPDAHPNAMDRDGFAVKLFNYSLGHGQLAVYPLLEVPATELGRARGFDIAASYSTTIRSADTETQLGKITSDHDRSGNDVLLISAGAPGTTGLPLIAEEIAVEPELLERMTMPKPRHLARVLLHRWSFGDVFELFPTFHRLVEPRVVSRGGIEIVPATPIHDADLHPS